MQHAQLTLAHIKIGDRNGIVYCRSRVKAHVKANELTLRFELNVKCKYSWDSTWKNFIGIVIAVVCGSSITRYGFQILILLKDAIQNLVEVNECIHKRVPRSMERKKFAYFCHIWFGQSLPLSCVCACVLFLPFSLNLFSSILGDYHNFSLYS